MGEVFDQIGSIARNGLTVSEKNLVKHAEEVLNKDNGLSQTTIDGKRHYVFPGGDSAPLVSVTTVIKDVIDKPALVGWAKNIGLHSANTVLNRYIGRTIDNNLMKSFLTDSKTELKKSSSSAADFGTMSHELIESLIKGERPVIPPEYQTVVDGFNMWRDKYDTRIIAVERPVFSTQLGVAGTIDALGFNKSELVVVDWKTSKGFYPEFALQAGGYINCLEEMLNRSITSAWIIRFGKERPEFDARAVNAEKAKAAFIRAKSFWDTLFLSDLWAN